MSLVVGCGLLLPEPTNVAPFLPPLIKLLPDGRPVVLLLLIEPGRLYCLSVLKVDDEIMEPQK